MTCSLILTGALSLKTTNHTFHHQIHTLSPSNHPFTAYHPPLHYYENKERKINKVQNNLFWCCNSKKKEEKKERKEIIFLKILQKRRRKKIIIIRKDFLGLIIIHTITISLHLSSTLSLHHHHHCIINCLKVKCAMIEKVRRLRCYPILIKETCVLFQKIFSFVVRA